jgi:hypothetical protein
MVLIKDHHLGYVSWEEYEHHQAMTAANNHMQAGVEPKAGRGGRALLSGLLRCRRCGRMLQVSYIGKRASVIHYQCNGAHKQRGKAAEQMRQQRQDLRKSITLEVEQARYEARLAARRYEAIDPDQRLVAAELEARWNATLQKAQELENKLREFDEEITSMPAPNKEVLPSLAQDLPAICNSPSTNMRLKQRLVRILIDEIVVDVDEKSREVVLVIHWAGGRHSELRVKKNRIGKHRRCTNIDAIAIILRMAERFGDEQIAATLNRLGLRTGADNNWNEARVRSARRYNQLSTFDPSYPGNNGVTLREAAQRLNVDLTIVRRMIPEKKLPASQVVACAPWQIPVEALESETKLIEPGLVQGTNFIEKAFENSKAAPKPPSYQSFVDQSLALYKEPSQLQCATESGQLRYLVGSDAVMF